MAEQQTKTPKKKRGEWTEADTSAIEAFINGDTADLDVTHSDRSIKNRFAQSFYALAKLSDNPAICHLVTVQIYQQAKASKFRMPGEAKAVAEHRAKELFCLPPRLPRGDKELAALRRQAWLAAKR